MGGWWFKAENGRRVVGQTIAGIEDLAQQVEQGAVVMVQLEHDSREVGQVLEVINGIAGRPTCWRSTPPSRRPPRTCSA